MEKFVCADYSLAEVYSVDYAHDGNGRSLWRCSRTRIRDELEYISCGRRLRDSWRARSVGSEKPDDLGRVFSYSTPDFGGSLVDVGHQNHVECIVGVEVASCWSIGVSTHKR